MNEQAREAAVNALRQDHMGAIYPTRKSGLKEIANAAIDAYNTKLREGMSDERDRLRAALFAWWDSLEPDDEVVADPLIDAILPALSVQRQDHTELIAEARIDFRPTSHGPSGWSNYGVSAWDLICRLADALEGKSDE